MPTAAVNAPRAASVRLRGIAAPLPPTTANKRARPPTVDSLTPAGSPLYRSTNDVITAPESLQRSPTKRSRTLRCHDTASGHDGRTGYSR
ncbi:hypothetical protein Sste5344_010471 [Sporothrix stenoceras]